MYTHIPGANALLLLIADTLLYAFVVTIAGISPANFTDANQQQYISTIMSVSPGVIEVPFVFLIYR